MEAQIDAACRRAGRIRSGVRLMAVSKMKPVALLQEAAAAGQQLFGENRVQEFGEKFEALAAAGVPVERNQQTSEPRSPGQQQALAVHLIGHLQSNKAGRAAEVFSAVDTLDSLRLAERLFEGAKRLGRSLPVLIEIKLSPEESKEGLLPESRELAHLLERLPDLSAHLPLHGLMTVAPMADDPEVAAHCFRTLHELRDRLAQAHPRLSFDELSMGMSGDFEAAIAEGSTTVRIGTAIFGARSNQNA